jgi:hypothetical protein
VTSPTIPNPGQSAAVTSSWRFDLVFLVLSLGLIVLVFGDALTGRSLLAPLDLAGDFYSQYKWLEPQADHIPQNHYVVDIFDHELPRQYSVFQALRRGEFPWWDPYTDNGRPLVTEAHIGSTDPPRLALYCVLPFELAYNWSKALSCLLFGVGGYLLLRSLGFPGWINVTCALAYQFASNHFLFQTPLCVTSSFAYYGLIWWAWARLATGFRWAHFMAAALLCACAAMAGNQQTHAYLALFTLCFVVGYGFKRREAWMRLLFSTFGSVLLGCLIALPVLVAQIELFLLCRRSPGLAGASLGWLAGVGAPVAIFPWLTGTFRTLDAGRAAGVNAIGFCLYTGSVALVLAGGGAVLYAARRTANGALRTALLLVLAYGLICVTPLLNILYTRSSDLAVLGLTVLSAYGLNGLMAGQVEKQVRQFMTGLCLACIGAFLLANAMAFLVVPRLEGKISHYVLERDRNNPTLPPVPEFRAYQVANLGREISLRNPETGAAVVGALGLLLVLRSRKSAGNHRNVLLSQAVLAVNLLPLLLFAHRFMVRQPVELWKRLLHEESPQSRLAGWLGSQYRFQDSGGRFERLYPGAMPQLFGVHSTHGYSSFPLPAMDGEIKALGLDFVNADVGEDWSGDSSLSQKPILRPPSSGTSRFQWEARVERPVKVLRESLNQVTIQVVAGSAGTLVRTDRYYPGWRVSQPKDLPWQVLGNSLLAVQVPAAETTLTFSYAPRYLSLTLPVSLMALAGFLGGGFWGLLMARKAPKVAPAAERPTNR